MSDLRKYEVTGYSDGLWCIVDTTKFLGERERHANWPMQVWDHPTLGHVGVFKDRTDAQITADDLNEIEDSQ